MSKIPIPITAAVAALAAVTLAGCAPGPTPETGAASTSASPSMAAVAALERDRALAERREIAANAAAGLPHGVDRALAEAAEADRVPFVFTVDQGGCSYLRLPDRSLWGLNTVGGTLARDTELQELLHRYGGGLPATDCTMRGVKASIPVGLDTAAADAANASGAPYRWKELGGGIPCKTFVRIPGSPTHYWLPDSPSTSGTALGTEVDRNACVDTPLPGQTKEGN